MHTYAALLRAVNVGGTGKLAMSDLVKICARVGFEAPTTYIQSGNVVFESAASEAEVKKTLEAALEKKMKKPVGVVVRRGAELDRVLAKNPFPDAPKNRVIVYFYDRRLPASALAATTGPDGEELVLRGRELYVHYPQGSGRSKVRIPSAALGTGRNLNTVAKLADMVKRRD